MRDTVRQWVQDTMSDASIDLSLFQPHSTREASASKAAKSRLSLDTIFRTAGWYQEWTFPKYYDKPIVQNVGAHVLQCHDNECSSGYSMQ